MLLAAAGWQVVARMRDWIWDRSLPLRSEGQSDADRRAEACLLGKVCAML